MKYSQIKAMKKDLDNMGCDDWREVVEKTANKEYDFTVGDYRFIDADCIDDIMMEELESDEYLLGSFNANFLIYYMDLEEQDIRHIQEKCPEAIGKMIIATGQLRNVQSGYAQADGYGHYFAHYDHEEWDLPCNMYGFRVN